MGTNYRAGKVVFDAVATVNDGVVCDPVYVGQASRIGVIAANTGANPINLTFEVSVNNQRSGGFNAVDPNWYGLHAINPATGAAVQVTVLLASGASKAIQLPDFAFNAIRAIATPVTPGAQGEINASISHVS